MPGPPEEEIAVPKVGPRRNLARSWRRFRDDECASGSGRAVFAATCVGIAILVLRLIG
ncbi:MAG: hypothetical protein WD066_04665 [Planctomycetaceae bacterium]